MDALTNHTTIPFTFEKPKLIQPSGFFKLSSPTSLTVTYTDLTTRMQEQHTVERTAKANKNNVEIFEYVLPKPFLTRNLNASHS